MDEINFTTEPITPRIHSKVSASYENPIGILHASVVFMGEQFSFSTSTLSPKAGDLVIFKGKGSVEQGNAQDKLLEYLISPHSPRKTSIGLSMWMFKL